MNAVPSAGAAAEAHTNTGPLRLDEIDAVVFDIGGVFTIRHPEPVLNGMRRGGFELPDDPERFHAAHYHAVRALTDTLLDGSGEPEASIDERDPAFWRNFEHGYFAHLGVEGERLDAAAEAMFAEVFKKEPHPVWRFVLERNVAGFTRIAKRLPVGIVTNNDGTAAEQLQQLGICQVGEGPLPSVRCIVDSGIIGIAKPDPAIFDPAMEAMGGERHRTLYVGDTWHADVVGANAAGLQVVQLDPYALHAHLRHARLPDVTALADVLGC